MRVDEGALQLVAGRVGKYFDVFLKKSQKIPENPKQPQISKPGTQLQNRVWRDNNHQERIY